MDASIYWLGLSPNPALDPLRKVVRGHVVKHVPITRGTKLFRRPAIEGNLSRRWAVWRIYAVCPRGGSRRVAAALGLIARLPSDARSVVVPRSLERPLTDILP